MAKKRKEQLKLFQKPKYKYLAKIVSLKSPAKARKSVVKLKKEFNSAKTDSKKVRIARATQQAANRALVTQKRKNLSSKEKKEFKEIHKIYNDAVDIMWKKYKR